MTAAQWGGILNDLIYIGTEMGKFYIYDTKTD